MAARSGHVYRFGRLRTETLHAWHRIGFSLSLDAQLFSGNVSMRASQRLVCTYFRGGRLREYTSAAFGFANMAILAVGGLFFQPLIGIVAKIEDSTRQMPIP